MEQFAACHGVYHRHLNLRRFLCATGRIHRPNASYIPTANLPPGTLLYWRVRTNGANPSLWTSSSFTTPIPPSNPVLSSPIGNAIIYTYTPTLKWKASVSPAGAPALAYYHLQIDNDSDYSSPIYDVTGLTATNFPILEELPANQRYFWRVRAVNTEGRFGWWASSSFRTVVQTPELLTPLQDAKLTSTKPVFDWSDVNLQHPTRLLSRSTPIYLLRSSICRPRFSVHIHGCPAEGKSHLLAGARHWDSRFEPVDTRSIFHDSVILLQDQHFTTS
jgi:hypothetical protein